jgi:protein-tyrosine-phosphatase
VDVFEEIRGVRGARCGMGPLKSPVVWEVAQLFGLRQDERCYKKIDKDDARRLICIILRQDLAYSCELMPTARSAELADRFLAQFESNSAYYTNGTWHLPDRARADGIVLGASWDPVTDATFDTGVLVIGVDRSGCVWVEDED